MTHPPYRTKKHLTLVQDSIGDREYLRRKREDQIRIQLDQFAKELSQVKAQRDEARK